MASGADADAGLSRFDLVRAILLGSVSIDPHRKSIDTDPIDPKNKLQKYRAEFEPEITREDFVQVIWSEASSDLKKATALMSAK